ncbi:NeuD/PglB/VioB family sugar acetyltransferase [Dyadobacter sp. NIV53]|uniref:NeuD/PglB/VioB family sugar acetyltransferase n=1 Tax=Dyadobacter sp. NIV53 TaxID=2861765 RepID=UPI00286DEB74|nr:NeuD/PglB/VioB family sugar acetyltransferase [Dyadobacter sp. NIV53]
MLIYGAGGHAKVIISCFNANGEFVKAIFDDDLSKTELSEIAVAGNYDPELFHDEPLIIAIGNNKIRRTIAQKIWHQFGIAVHPTAIADKSAVIGEGTVVLQGSILQADTVIGRHVIINTRVIVEHECKIADFVHLAPGVTLCGNVNIGENTLIGAGSIVVPNISIGSNCLIAAGSVITHNIPDGAIVRGNPGRIIKVKENSIIENKIWLSSPHQSGSEMKYILEAFDTNWLAPIGPNIDLFEKELGTYTNCDHVAALSSGTAALHLALIMLDVKRDDIVLCQSLTFAASANPITYLGAKPVFIDSEINTWNICPDALEEALKYYTRKGKKPKAVIGVHLYGIPCQLEEILYLCQKYEIPFVEDAAEALGSTYKGKKLGSWGDMGVLSFNGNKVITTSGGGALLSNNESFITKARFLATQARDNAAHYEHSQIGYNYRLSNVCAGIGRGQLEVIEKRVKQRRANFEFYKERLQNLPGLSFQNELPESFSNRWLTAMSIDPSLSDGVNREQIRIHLQQQNIESRPVWKPMHMQPVFKNTPYFGGRMAENIFENGLCLPSGSNLSTQDLSRICDSIEAGFNKS